MFGIHSDLPLRGDAAGRFVQWLVMVLVFMAALAVTVNAYVGELLDGWNTSVSGTLTVQVPIGTAGEKGALAEAKKVVGALTAHPAVARADIVTRDKVMELLEPWLGKGEAVTDLPLPVLIDVELRSGEPDTAADVGKVAQSAAPGAVVDDHRVWLNRVMGLARGFGVVALTIMVLVTGALGLTVVFATRASLVAFAQVIEVLHVVGAKDGYVAGQFARRALAQGILGGLAGLALYAPALGLVAYLASRVQPQVLPEVTLPVIHWLTLALLPVVAGLLAMFTANVTVRRTLASKV